MLGLSLWEGRLPGQKTIENEDKAAMGSYRPESNFGTSDTVGVCKCVLCASCTVKYVGVEPWQPPDYRASCRRAELFFVSDTGQTNTT